MCVAIAFYCEVTPVCDRSPTCGDNDERSGRSGVLQAVTKPTMSMQRRDLKAQTASTGFNIFLTHRYRTLYASTQVSCMTCMCNFWF